MKAVRNHEITSVHPLLDERGILAEAGYSKRELLTYNRFAIKANPWRIKEWDYYLISNNEFAVALTIADNSYMGLISASLLDFKKPSQLTTSIMTLAPGGKMKLPSSSKSGDAVFRNKRVKAEFYNDGSKRQLNFKMKKFHQTDDLFVELELFDEPEESMVIATPFKEDKKAFYYNQKINPIRAKGKVLFAGHEYLFDPADSFAVLDWGRGVWTYKNTWYWGSASGLIDGVPFGFNIGYGFGDTTAATENMLFYQGRAHKLDDVNFQIPINKENSEEYMKPWTFHSSDGRFEMTFHPIIDRYAYSSVLFISSNQHQVFGRFSGKVILDDGKEIIVKDLLGFAEKVSNKW